MLNRDFLKRLVFRFSHGQGGWLPWYNFYTGSPENFNGYTCSSQIVLAPERPDPARGHLRPTALAAAFSLNGDAAAPALFDDVHDSGEHIRFVRSFSNPDGSKPQAVDIIGGVKQAVALQNHYMSYATVGEDPEGLQLRVRIPLSVTDLDPDILIDPVPGPFNFNTFMDVYMDPDVQSGGNVQLSEMALRTLRLRMTSGRADDDTNRLGAITLDAYADNFNGYAPSDSTVPFVTSSNLDFDPLRPPLRFAGYQFGDYLTYMLTDVDANLLKLNLLADPMHEAFLNPNCVLLSLHAPFTWYMPVAAVLQGGLQPMTKVSAVYKTTFNRPSFNVAGFGTNTDPVVATAGIRPRVSCRNVITIDRNGPAARATYKVERYSEPVIEHMLTSHLPYTDAYGEPARYFTKRASLLHDTDGPQGRHENTGNLQPVAFPAGQRPEDPWLWFVSMDDEFAVWLNRYELGKANTAECVVRLPSSPTQLVVGDDDVFLVYGAELLVLNITTRVLTSYKCGAELPGTRLLAIAIDREQNRVWIGHETGVFEFDSGIVHVLDVSTLPAQARRVARQALVAVNGYLAWNTADYFAPLKIYEPVAPAYVVRVHVASGTKLSWTFQDVTSDGTLGPWINFAGNWQQLGKVGLRSNGDLLITHTERAASYGKMQVGMSWCRVQQDGTLFRKHWCGRFCLTGSYSYEYADAAQPDEHLVYMAPVHRIDDFHYASGGIPFRYPEVGGDMIAHEKNVFTFDQTNYGTPCLAPSGPAQALEFRLDEEMNWIHLHPYAYSRDQDDLAHSGVTNFGDLINFPAQRNRLIPSYALTSRGGDFEFALYSVAVIVLDKCYSIMAAGSLCTMPMGIELDWDGSDWVHKQAGAPARPRAMHTSAQPISPNVSIAFDPGSTGFVFQKSSCYRVDVAPGTSAPIPKASLYLGDYTVTSESTLVMPSGAVKVAASMLDTFCGIDVDNTKDLGAAIGASVLTLVAANPSPVQFSVSRDGTFQFNTAHAGATAQITYNYISQAG